MSSEFFRKCISGECNRALVISYKMSTVTTLLKQFGHNSQYKYLGIKPVASFKGMGSCRGSKSVSHGNPVCFFRQFFG